MTHIDDLPVYVWPDIFRNLSIKDIINCRLVNKKFRDFSDFNNCISKLIINESNLISNEYWYFINKLIDKEDVISFNYFQRIKSVPLFNLNTNLKYLRIDHKVIDINGLSDFINLEYLEINDRSWNPRILIFNLNLNLNNLKILALDTYERFFLNTPKLEKIKLTAISKINIQSNPNSIKHLILDRNDYNQLMRICENLETIELNWTPSVDLLNIFNNLNKLRININNYSKYFSINLRKILIKKLELNRDFHIDIYSKDIKLLNIQMADQIGNFNDLKYQLDYFDLLDFNLAKSSINYNYLERLLTDIKNDLPATFFNKYSNLSHVYVSDNVKNVDNLNWFIRKLMKNSIKLTINNTILNQNFYDNLPDKITWFETEQDHDFFQLALNLFLKLKILEHFEFKFKSKTVEIKRENRIYRLFVNYLLRSKKINIENLDLNNLDFNNLVKMCNQIRNTI